MSVFNAPSFDHHELVAFTEDEDSGLKAIIAVHNTALGQAVGGCRFYPYTCDADALDDVLRLSRGMTYKSALAGLPMGGGKAVIIGDPQRLKTPALLRAMGRFIDGLGGQYITAEDSGTGVADMKVMAEMTRHVSGISKMDRFGGDPSPYTAYGIYCGIVAALQHRMGAASVKGVRVAVQGAGAVGRYLIERLLRHGASVVVADINPEHLRKAQALGASTCAVDDIMAAYVDVIAPCAMGSILNDVSLPDIKAGIIAGGANNQLAQPRHGEWLAERGILYAPDFVINAGGIIAVHHQQTGSSEAAATAHVEGIGSKLREIFLRSEAQQVSTHSVAENMAEAIFRTPESKGCSQLVTCGHKKGDPKVA